VHAGQTLPGVVGIEYSSVDLDTPTPRPIEVLFHSPVVCGTTLWVPRTASPPLISAFAAHRPN
jgi:hypothetical protein